MTDTGKELAAGIRSTALARLKELGTPINIRIGVSGSYSDLLRGEFAETVDADVLLGKAATWGRVILSARGGSGKTTLMNRLAVAAANAGKVPVLVELSGWSADATEAWRSKRDSFRAAADMILERFAVLPTSLAQLDAISPATERVVLLDGLNEVPGSVADEILDLADRLASLMIRCSVIVSDRLVRRQLKSEADRWLFAAPLPIDSDEIRRLVASDEVPPGGSRLLSSPFFVDRAIRGELAASALGTIRAHIQHHGGIPSGLVDSVAKGAFEAYRIDGSRTFSPARFEEAGSASAIEPMVESGLLVRPAPESLAFAHHWYHDYLASSHVVHHGELLAPTYRHESLDALTFCANSFDAVAFALEQLAGERGDEFLRAVYDWNPYAAGYALAEVEASGGEAVSPSVRTVMLAMLADKLFDRHYMSQRRAADALNLFRDGQAVQLREVDDRSELVDLIREAPNSGEEFEIWRSVFTLPTGSVAPSAVIEALEGEDSILGWTAANMLKRLTLEESQLDTIIADAVRDDRPVVRWRACHVLGGREMPKAVDALLNRLEQDPDENVRYGAVRSLIETASLSDETSLKVLGRVQPLLRALVSSPRVLTELQKAAFLTPGSIPPHWSERISELLYPEALASGDVSKLEEWSQLTVQLREHERVQQSVAA